MTRVTWLTVCAGAPAVVGISGCNSRSPVDRDGAAGKMTAGGAAGATGGATDAAGGSRGGAAGTGGGSAGTGGVAPAAAGAGTGGAAGTGRSVRAERHLACTPAGGRYCDTIGNGCPGGRLECGACGADARHPCSRQRLRGRTELHAAHVQPGPHQQVLRPALATAVVARSSARRAPPARTARAALRPPPGCTPDHLQHRARRQILRREDRYGCSGALDCGACSGGQICRWRPGHGHMRHAGPRPRPDCVASPATAFPPPPPPPIPGIAGALARRANALLAAHRRAVDLEDVAAAGAAGGDSNT